jgi:nitrite reductase/ring-hydroxylating ferredoxin subunit
MDTKKAIIFFAFILIFACESNDYNSRCDIINNQTINLANPQFIDLQVPGGWAYSNGGPKGLVIYNLNNSYKAFSRECPSDKTCANKMSIVNDFKLVCPCDDSEYSIIDGQPQTTGFTVPVCEFTVNPSGNTILIITN